MPKFNSEIRGFYNYYAFAHNASQMIGSFGYVMKYSFYKTMAQKLNSSIRKVCKQFRRGKDFVVPYKDAKGKEKFIVLYNEGYKRKWQVHTLTLTMK